MVALAAAKAGPRARLAVHDMRELPVLGEFDLITCLDDALNYLLERQELVAALRGMRRNLAPAGVVVADVNTIATYRGFFADLDVLAEEDRVLVWRGGGSPRVRPGERVDAALEVLARADDGPWRSAIHTHRQRHHPAAAMRTALSAAGLEPVAIRGVTPDGRLHERADELAHTKVVYIARAAG